MGVERRHVLGFIKKQVGRCELALLLESERLRGRSLLMTPKERHAPGPFLELEGYSG